MKQSPSKLRERLPWVVSLALVLLCIVLAIVTYLGIHGPDAKGELDEASFFSNIASPYIALAGAIITFAAFWIQYQANTEMRQSLQDQDKELKDQKHQQSIDRFEKIFFEMVHIHRENTAALELPATPGHNLSGNKAIRAIMIEIEVSYWVLNRCQQGAFRSALQGHTPWDLISAAYVICYEGHYTGSEGRMDGRALLLPDVPHLTSDQASELMEVLTIYLSHFFLDTLHQLPEKTVRALALDAMPSRSPHYPTGEAIRNVRGHLPGQGTRDDLSGYFRHLFHTFKYLDDNKVIDASAKRTYAGMLRAHISDEAQALLYYNSLTIWGKVWWGSKIAGSNGPEHSGMLMQYKLLRNIPLDQIAGDISPLHLAVKWLGITPDRITREALLDYFHYLDIEDYFDWAFTNPLKSE